MSMIIVTGAPDVALRYLAGNRSGWALCTAVPGVNFVRLLAAVQAMRCIPV